MKMEKTLVILAAGMGTRFGGLKQIEPVGPNGEIIADYSVYDAIKAGFTKVIFVIKEENLTYFKEHITSKYQDKIKVLFAFQTWQNVPSFVHIPAKREKMLGTADALLSCEKLINEPFAMINADDFYGASAYQIASKFLEENSDPYTYLSVNYPFYLAKSEHGKVNRGVVNIKDGYIENIDECTIYEEENKIIAENKKTKERKVILKEQEVSLNFFVLKPSIFNLIKEEFKEFWQQPITMDNELILTDVLKKYIRNKQIKFKAASSLSNWLGVTYKEDLSIFKEKLNKLIEKGVYPREL